jgi:trans-2,3-dihydro-3-hydroxyanthranilate isomerase
MSKYDFATVDVFTTTRFGGNQLAVFTDAAGLSDAEMQSLAAEMNYSETTFVLPPQDPANTAHVRIFNRTAEMPFAGHPNVGTAFVLAGLRAELGDFLRFEEQAGLVEVRVERGQDGRLHGAEIDAPQALQLMGEFEPADVAKCIGLLPGDIRVETHRPVRATVGVEFVLIEVAADKLSEAAPDLAAFREVAARHERGRRLSLFIYAPDGDAVRARMFAPLAGTWEDPATGSASATLGALLLHHSDDGELAIDIRQGVEMGRPSALKVRARRTADGIRASVGGTCVPIFRGFIEM